MLLCTRNHSQYQEFIRKSISALWLLDPEKLLYFEHSLTKLWLLNLDPATLLLAPYFPQRGRPIEFEPIDILRSLILMSGQKVSGITKWVAMLRSDKILAALSGFLPNHTPGVGTFYDFINRFWLEAAETQRERKKKLRKPSRKPNKKLKAGEKLPPKHPEIVGKLCDCFLNGRNNFPFRAERLIQQVFARCVVDHSVTLGLIPNPSHLIIAADGTSIRTRASPYGVKICDCRQKGIYNCDCKRRYGDPQATWGWDSQRKEYFYGYTLYELTAVESPHSLPLYLRFAQAQRHDSVMGVVTLAEFPHVYPTLGIDKWLGDSAHDVYPFYQLLSVLDIEPFIDLNSRNQGHYHCTPPFAVNDIGIPICPNGHQMIFCGHQKDRNRLK